MSKIKMVLGLLFLSLLFSVSPALAIDPVKFEAVADSRVQQEAPTYNYGSYNPLIFGDRSSIKARWLAFKFNLSAIPRDANIETAYLRLFVNSTTSLGCAYNVARIVENWSESTISWQNKPDYVNTDYSGVILQNNDAVLIDVKNLVKGWITPGAYSNYGLYLLSRNVGE
ncbi:MAG: DNRLRE domain-containing protein, partial [Candidatus Shapirobacteria bacterium]